MIAMTNDLNRKFFAGAPRDLVRHLSRRAAHAGAQMRLLVASGRRVWLRRDAGRRAAQTRHGGREHRQLPDHRRPEHGGCRATGRDADGTEARRGCYAGSCDVFVAELKDCFDRARLRGTAYVVVTTNASGTRVSTRLSADDDVEACIENQLSGLELRNFPSRTIALELDYPRVP